MRRLTKFSAESKILNFPCFVFLSLNKAYERLTLHTLSYIKDTQIYRKRTSGNHKGVDLSLYLKNDPSLKLLTKITLKSTLGTYLL